MQEAAPRRAPGPAFLGVAKVQRRNTMLLRKLAAAAVVGGIVGRVLWQRWCRQSLECTACALPALSDFGSVHRALVQYKELIKIEMFTRRDAGLLRAIRERAAKNVERGVQVFTECRCGACRVVAEHGGPPKESRGRAKGIRKGCSKCTCVRSISAKP